MMNFRLANLEDLPQLKVVYRKIIDNMNKNDISIWDEIYPCEFLKTDIENGILYILEDDSVIISAFALCETNSGEPFVTWENANSKAMYLDRFGVNVDYAGRGIGSFMLKKAISLAGEKNAEYLRLFVVDINEPAIKLYIKNGFKRAGGIYDEVIDNELVLHEIGFEIKTVCKY